MVAATATMAVLYWLVYLRLTRRARMTSAEPTASPLTEPADRHRALTAQTMSVLQPVLDQIEKFSPRRPN